MDFIEFCEEFGLDATSEELYEENYLKFVNYVGGA